MEQTSAVQLVYDQLAAVPVTAVQSTVVRKTTVQETTVQVTAVQLTATVIDGLITFPLDMVRDLGLDLVHGHALIGIVAIKVDLDDRIRGCNPVLPTI